MKSVNNDMLALLVLVVTAFVAHFLYMNGFGLYADDYSFTYMGHDDEVFDSMKSAFLHWPQGRPFQFSVPWLITLLTEHSGSFIPVYIVAWLIIATNAILVYCCLRQISPLPVSLVGALVYLLFPADTSKILLIHALGIQVGLLFTLIGCLLYLKGARLFAYIISTMALLSYETTWLPILLLPLLTGRINRKWFVAWLKHLAILALILSAVIAIRAALNEARVVSIAGTDSYTLFVKSLSLFFLGPLVSGLTFFIRPYTAIADGNAVSFFLMIVVAVFLAFVFKKLMKDMPAPGMSETTSDGPQDSVSWLTRIQHDSQLQGGLRLVTVGLLMWMSVYAFSYTHWPAFEIAGRLTSVHSAASIPTAIIAAGAVWLLACFCRTAARLFQLFSIVSVYLALLAGFHIVVQNDYVAGWNYQKDYWRQVLTLAPDIRAGTQVFVMRVGDMPATKYVETHSWADYKVLSKFYDTGTKDNDLIPKIDIINNTNIDSFKVRNGKLYRRSMRPMPGGGQHSVVEQLDPDKLIFLMYKKDDSLIRLRHSVTLNKLRIPLPEPGNKSEFQPTILYHMVMD